MGYGQRDGPTSNHGIHGEFAVALGKKCDRWCQSSDSAGNSGRTHSKVCGENIWNTWYGTYGTYAVSGVQDEIFAGTQEANEVFMWK